MPLETATYVSQLVSSNPAHSDGLNNADAHARLIKGSLLATFPNFTAAPLTSTQAQLDGAAAKVNTNGVAILADTGAFFKTNTTDGLTNPAAGSISLSLAGNIAETNVRSGGVNTKTWTGNAAITGTLGVTGAITGPGTVPIGGMIMWTTDTLPTGAGVWAWANGGTLSRTTPGAGKELFDLYAAQLGSGTFYGVGNGTTTFNVINMQEVVPVGKSTMGGATSPGLLATISGALKGVLGGLFGADTHTIAAGNVPTLNSSGNNTISVSVTALNTPPNNFPAVSAGGSPLAGWTSLISNSVFSASGNNTINVAYTNASPTAINNEQPSRAVNFIIRIA